MQNIPEDLKTLYVNGNRYVFPVCWNKLYNEIIISTYFVFWFFFGYLMFVEIKRFIYYVLAV